MNLVDAQQARRVLDRVVGYSLSPVLWKKVRRGLSAGRVQSVAVRLIVEREAEIEKFKVENYYKVLADLKVGFEAEMTKKDGESVYKQTKLNLFDGVYKYTQSIWNDKNQLEKYISKLPKELLVSKLSGREVSKTPPPALS